MTNENILETVELNSAEFRALCRRAAEGDAEAQYRVGQSLMCAGESDEGREWIRKSFESGRRSSAVEVAGFLREEKKLMAAAELLESVADEIPAAKLKLAMCCLNGEGVKKDPVRAERLLQEIARDGDGEAKLAMARRYKYGDGVVRSFGRAMNWLGQAMESGCENAMERYYAEEREAERLRLEHLREEEERNRKLEQEREEQRRRQEELLTRAESGDVEAVLTLADEETVPDQKEAWYRKAAELDCTEAQLWLGKACEEKKILTAAAEWYRKAAELGCAEAQNRLGRCYYNGYGVNKDECAAADWFRKAAEQGFAAAEHNLGLCYRNGWGVEKDTAKAVEWYKKAAARGYEKAVLALKESWATTFAEVERIRKAAERGDAEEQYNLGLCYCDGRGVEKDAVEAVKWYRKAAEQGFAAAQHSLGRCYFHGIGVEEDGTKAAEWLRKAADQGGTEACELLGKCYETGFGAEKSRSKADQWYLKAGVLNSNTRRLLERADQDGRAQYELGLRYLDGETAVGTGWLEKAAENGHKDAAYKLAGLAFAAKDYDKAKEWYLKYGMENATLYVDAERGNAEAQYLYAKETKSLSAQEREKYYRMAAEQDHAEAKAWVDQEMQRIAAEMEAQKKAREEKARKEKEEAQKRKRRKALDKPLTALFVLMIIALALLAVRALFRPRGFGYIHLGAMVVAQVVLLLCYLLSYSPPDWIVRTRVWSKFCGIVWLVVAVGMALQLVFRSSGLVGATALRFGITLLVSLVGASFFLRRAKKPKIETKKR